MKKDVKVPGFPQIYKVVEIRPDGKEVPTGTFRVRKRVKVDTSWKTQTQTFYNFEEAKRFAKTIVTPRGFLVNLNKGHVFEEVMRRFFIHKAKEMKLCQATIDGYKNRAAHLAFFSGIEMQSIKATTIDEWLNLLLEPDYLKKQHKTRVNYSHEFTLLSNIFRYYRNYENEQFLSPMLDRHRARAFARGRSEGKEIRYLNVHEEIAFLRQLEGFSAVHDLALFQLQTGTRVGEAAALEFRNIDFIRKEVRICQHLHWERKANGQIFVMPGTKGGPSRVVPLTDRCFEMLKERKAQLAGEIVFPYGASWLPYRTIQNLYDRAFTSIGLKLSGTHTLRHTFAVRFLDETKDIYALQKVLGHTDLEVTQIYAKYSSESVRKSFQLFNGGKDSNVVDLVTKAVTK